jgi:hypothetical protein
MSFWLQRLCSGITRSLFLEDREQYFQSLTAYDVAEFEP